MFYQNQMDGKYYEVFDRALDHATFKGKLEAGETFILGQTGPTTVALVSHGKNAATKHHHELAFRFGAWDFREIDKRTVKIAAMKGSDMAACFLLEVKDGVEDDSKIGASGVEDDVEDDSKIGATANLEAALAKAKEDDSAE